MSAKGFYLVQDGHFVDLIKPVSAGAAQVATRFTMAQYAHASLLLRFGAAGGPIGAVTLKIYPTLTGGTGVAVPFKYYLQNSPTAPFDLFGPINQATATGYTPASDLADADVLIEFDSADLLIANNGTYVELNIGAGSLGTTPQLMDALGILSGGRTQNDTASAQV